MCDLCCQEKRQHITEIPQAAVAFMRDMLAQGRLHPTQYNQMLLGGVTVIGNDVTGNTIAREHACEKRFTFYGRRHQNS